MKETKETLDTLDTLATLDTMDTPKGTKNQYVIFQPSSPQDGLTREHMVPRRDLYAPGLYLPSDRDPKLGRSFTSPFRYAKC